jgi:2-hydroxychromene-2-carboxylate isomerase
MPRQVDYYFSFQSPWAPYRAPATPGSGGSCGLHVNHKPLRQLDGEVFWGQDRIELLADALRSGRAPYRSQA